MQMQTSIGEISSSNIILPNGRKVEQEFSGISRNEKPAEAALEQEYIRRRVLIEKSRDGIVVLKRTKSPRSQ